jgi:sulfur-oxidizing protein SoxA
VNRAGRALTTAVLAVAAAASAETRRSGFDDMSPATQALQRDDAQNPAALWLKEGEQRFAADCARCHAVASMAGVAARHPAWDERTRRPVTLAQRIEQCRVRQAGAAPQPPDSVERLGLEAWIGRQSRGLPIAPPDDPRLTPWREAGRALFQRPLGQLGLSCAQCHDAAAGGRLAGSTVPQGHPTAYPIYRLEWQTLGGLTRRLRNCTTGVRAEPFPEGSDEALQLELYLMQRAAGLPLETPGVRP